ncbi:MAG: hypothetical protein OEM24_02115 [Paracoccaceae bacterium]|nr:hypothetical protein [Paracoccaceae bacterium]
MRAIPALIAVLALVGCATTAESVWAPDADVQRAAYVHEGPSTVTLYTVINNRSGESGHTAVMINGYQRIMWDPAGTWWNPISPERNDVHYGISPRMEEIYVDYHARVTWRVVIQEVPVSRSTANGLISAFEGNGAAGKATCALVTSRVLQKFPEFASVGTTWYPKRLMEDFDALPGMTKSVVYDDDDDNNQPLLRQQIAAGQNGLL